MSEFRAAQIDNSNKLDIKTRFSTPTGTAAMVFTHPGAGNQIGAGITPAASTGIFYSSAAPSTNFASVPNGSFVVDASNGHIHVKIGMPGSGIGGALYDNG